MLLSPNWDESCSLVSISSTNLLAFENYRESFLWGSYSFHFAVVNRIAAQAAHVAIPRSRQAASWWLCRVKCGEALTPDIDNYFMPFPVRPPHVCTAFAQQSFACVAAQVWNSISHTITDDLDISAPVFSLELKHSFTAVAVCSPHSVTSMCLQFAFMYSWHMACFEICIIIIIIQGHVLMKCAALQTWRQKSNQLVPKRPIQRVCVASRFWTTINSMCIHSVLTSCERGDTICPHPSPPLWAPKRLMRHLADAK